jgi:hypothetical protein
MLKDGVSGKEYGIAIHGNRLIAMMVFEKLGSNKLGESNFNFDDATKEETMLDHTKYYFAELRDGVETNYTNAIIPTLFKNLTKCKYLVELCRL